MNNTRSEFPTPKKYTLVDLLRLAKLNRTRARPNCASFISFFFGRNFIFILTRTVKHVVAIFCHKPEIHQKKPHKDCSSLNKVNWSHNSFKCECIWVRLCLCGQIVLNSFGFNYIINICQKKRIESATHEFCGLSEIKVLIRSHSYSYRTC